MLATYSQFPFENAWVFLHSLKIFLLDIKFWVTFCLFACLFFSSWNILCQFFLAFMGSVEKFLLNVCLHRWGVVFHCFQDYSLFLTFRILIMMFLAWVSLCFFHWVFSQLLKAISLYLLLKFGKYLASIALSSFFSPNH